MKYLGPISDPKDIVNKEYVDNSSGGGHIVLTQAEYDDLSSAEKNNGTVYFIPDGEPEYTIINDTVPIGAIQAYGGSGAPYGWLLCDGAAVSRETYSELFEAIGTTYGSGDGSTTFNVPDLAGRVITGVGTCDSVTYALGDKKSAGVPNITGRFSSAWNTAVRGFWGFSSSGAYYADIDTSKAGRITSEDNYAYTNTTAYPGFDASLSNNHYGASDTVQPNTTVCYYIIKAQNTLSSERLEELDPQHVLFDMLYPVGSYYETSDSTFDPNEQWTGTWVLETEGLVHISAGSTYDVGDTGGEATHTLLEAEMPNHYHHSLRWGVDGDYFGVNSSGGGRWTMAYSGGTVGCSQNNFYTDRKGGDQPHNNMQPYIVVNRWHRTA